MSSREASEEECANSICFNFAEANIPPTGPVQQIVNDETISEQVTTELARSNYRRGALLSKLCEEGFDAMTELTEGDGSTTWEYRYTEDGKTCQLHVNQAKILQSFVLTEVKSGSELEEKAAEYEIEVEQTYIIIDGVKYFVDLNIPLDFFDLDTPSAVISLSIFVLGQTSLSAAVAAIAAEFGTTCFSKAFKEINGGVFDVVWRSTWGAVKAGFRFVSSFAGKMIAGGTVDEAVAAGQKAAGKAWKKATRKLTKAVMKHSVAGLVIMAGVILFTQLILHYSYQSVYVYNLTSYDIELDFPYTWNGEITSPPSEVIKGIGPTTAGGFDTGEWYHGTGFRVSSDSSVYGIEFSMRFKLKDSEGNLFETVSALFCIPWSGKNSLHSTFEYQGETAGDYEKYLKDNWEDYRWLKYTSEKGDFEAVVTYDYLQDKHPVPGEDGDKKYYYESLVIIRKKP